MMKNIQKLISMYLNDKTLAWASSTMKSESHRLNAAAPMLNGNAQKLWDSLQEHGAYGKATIWTRVTDFWQWCIDNEHVKGPNPYKAFRSKNAKQFKNVYDKKLPEIGYEEAINRIRTIPNEAIRRRALEILSSGLRWSESERVIDSKVMGKGSKQRTVFVQPIEGPDYRAGYTNFLRALKKVGLKPHDLRKIFLTRLVEMGANEFELREVAGWSSLAPATSYIKANDGRIKNLVKQVQGVSTNDSKESLS